MESFRATQRQFPLVVRKQEVLSCRLDGFKRHLRKRTLSKLGMMSHSLLLVSRDLMPDVVWPRGGNAVFVFALPEG